MMMWRIDSYGEEDDSTFMKDELFRIELFPNPSPHLICLLRLSPPQEKTIWFGGRPQRNKSKAKLETINSAWSQSRCRGICLFQIGGNGRMKKESSKQFEFILELFRHSRPSESCHQPCTLPRIEEIPTCYRSATLSRTLGSLAVGKLNGWPVALNSKQNTRTSGHSRTQSLFGYSKYPRGCFFAI